MGCGATEGLQPFRTIRHVLVHTRDLCLKGRWELVVVTVLGDEGQKGSGVCVTAEHDVS